MYRIGGVEADAVAGPADALGRDHRRAAAEKAIEHDVAAGRAVQDRIGGHRNRFDGRVQRQQIAFLAAAGKGIGSGIIPDIAAVAAELAELDMLRPAGEWMRSFGTSPPRRTSCVRGSITACP